MRDKAGIVRAFHNVCRHRGSRVVGDMAGSCGSAFVCPFHGWSYNLDGSLRTTPAPRSLPELDPQDHGLIPVEHEIWQGFVFVRFQPGPQPSVAEIMQRHLAEIAPYMAELASAEKFFWEDKIDSNWKCVRDVDNEGYHVPMAHPGLQDLYGQTYFDEPWRDGTSRSFAELGADEGKLWSVRHYKKLLPEVNHLPQTHRRAWFYIGMFPNAVLYFYPDSMGFYQEFPIDVSHTRLRGKTYVLPDGLHDFAGDNRSLRCLRAARYLNRRIQQ